MCQKNRELAKILEAKPGTDPLQSAGSSTLFHPISIMLQIFTEDSVIL